MLLAPHFSFSEMTRTNHRSWLEVNRSRAELHMPALRAVAEMLEIIRANWGRPLIVHSGFRCAELNIAIGGSKRSQHLRGEAADFHVHGVPLTEVWEWIWQDSQLSFGQLILEGWRAGEPSWIHLSLGPPWRLTDRSGQVMTWDLSSGYHLVGRNHD